MCPPVAPHQASDRNTMSAIAYSVASSEPRNGMLKKYRSTTSSTVRTVSASRIRPAPSAIRRRSRSNAFFGVPESSIAESPSQSPDGLVNAHDIAKEQRKIVERGGVLFLGERGIGV